MSFVVLFVCTGNICRSPVAERLFAARVREFDVTVLSAGTSGLTGFGMDAPSARALRELGGDADGHVAQVLTSGLVERADLVLTAEQAHRDLIVHTDPAAAARTFTVREFARLGTAASTAVAAAAGAAGAAARAAGAAPIAASTPESLRARVAEIDARRRTARPGRRRDDDIGDPYGAAMSQVRACAGQIAEAVEGAVAALGLAEREASEDNPQSIKHLTD